MTYDIVFLGASPYSMLEASFHHLIGKKVIILEKDQELGGAWRVQKNKYFDSVDEAPHILQPYPNVYRFVEDVLRVPLRDVTDRAFSITSVPLFGHWTHPYNCWPITDLTSLINTLKLQMSAEKSGFKSYNSVMELFTKAKTEKSARIKFFSNGTEDFIEKIYKFTKQIGLEIKKGTNVKSLDGSKNDVNLRLEVGDYITTKSVHLPTNASIESINFPDFTQGSMNFIQKTLCLTILVEDQSTLSFEIANFIDHRFLRFVTNVTSVCQFSSEFKACGFGVLKVFCRPNIPVSSTLGAAAINELVLLGLAEPHTKIAYLEEEWHERPKIPGGIHKQISDALGSRVVAARTNNLAEVFSSRIPEWERAFNTYI